MTAIRQTVEIPAGSASEGERRLTIDVPPKYRREYPLTYVLDACALIALFRQEPGMDKVMALIDGADKGRVSLSMYAVNRIEVDYRFTGNWTGRTTGTCLRISTPFLSSGLIRLTPPLRTRLSG